MVESSTNENREQLSEILKICLLSVQVKPRNRYMSSKDYLQAEREPALSLTIPFMTGVNHEQRRLEFSPLSHQ